MVAFAGKDMAEATEVRSNFLGLLVTVFRVEPSLEFLDQLKTPTFFKAAEAFGVTLGSRLQITDNNELARDLAGEYKKLFIRPDSRLSPHKTSRLELDGDTANFWYRKTIGLRNS